MSVKPIALGRVRPLLASESADPSVSGEDYDWDGGGFAGEASVNDQWKQPCRAATTASITIATALNNGDTLDGITLATGDRVLVKDQSAGAQNGIYIVGTNPERVPDFDDDDEVLGALVYVIAGTTNAATAWKVTNTTAVTVGSTSIVFAAFGSGGSTSFGTPANTYGTPAAGAASTAIRTDAALPGPPIVILTLTNKSGGGVAAGDVVKIDTANDTAFTTTTTGQAEVSVGIAQATIANNAAGAVLVSGYAALVNVPASVTRGHYVETYTVVKQATGSSSRRAGSFGQFLTGGTTPSAWLWGQTDQTATGGGATITTKDEGSTLSSTVTTLDFVGAGVTASGAGATTTITIPGGGSTDYVSGATGTGHITIPGLAVPDTIAGGGSDDEFDTTDTSDPMTGWSTLGSFDTVDMNSSARSHLRMSNTSIGYAVNGIYKAAPSTPFTVTAKLSAFYAQSNYVQAGIMLTDSTPTALYICGPLYLNTYSALYPFDFAAGKWGSRTSRSSASDTNMTARLTSLYLRLVVTSSSNIDVQYSFEGFPNSFITVYAAQNSGITVSKVGLCVAGNTSGGRVDAYFDWIRFT